MIEDVVTLFQKHMATLEVIDQNTLFHLVLNAVGICALRNDKTELALRCLTALCTRKHGTHEMDSSFLEAVFDRFCYSEDPEVWAEHKDVIETMFDTMHKNNQTLKSDKEMHIIRNWFRSIGDERWRCRVVDTTRLRIPECPFTGVPLVPASLTPKEYDIMKNILLQSVMKKVFVDTHVATANDAKMQNAVHMKSPGAMLADDTHVLEFLQYLHDHGPFDIVVDGLNIVYKERGMTRNKKNKIIGRGGGTEDFGFDRGLNALRGAIVELRRRSKRDLKVLIPFRSHMKKHLQAYGGGLEEVANVVYVSNRMADDSFCFYATICSGPNCLLASSDLFRDYKAHLFHELGSSASQLFYKYQRSRQFDLTLKKGVWRFTTPNVVDATIQRTENTWHFPFVSDTQRQEQTHYGAMAQSLLCVFKES